MVLNLYLLLHLACSVCISLLIPLCIMSLGVNKLEETLITSIATLAGGTLIYVGKEVLRFIFDLNLSRKKVNIEHVYPIYLSCFKQAKKAIGARNIPNDNDKFVNIFDENTYRDLDDTQKDIYRTNLPYRQYMNLRHRLNLLERYKTEFNNEISLNQVFFKRRFVFKTTKIVQALEDDISYLSEWLATIEAQKQEIDMSNIISSSYSDKLQLYEDYLDQFELEIKKQFKI